MNETNLTPRQKFILNIINESEGLRRDIIQRKIESDYALSKPTLIRDLNYLIHLKLIKITGKGKITTYKPVSESPLLRPFDLDQYFTIDPDERKGAKKIFDFGVFEDLHDLFSIREADKINTVKKSFTSQTNRLSPDLYKKELERFIIELSWKSSKIEGNTYTLLETERLIREKEEAQGHDKKEAIMILNHKEAFETILSQKNSFNRISISQISELHNLMVKGLSITTGIRKQAVGITGTVYRPLDNEFQIKEALEKFILTVNNSKDVLIKALIANIMISYIQPFSDGNKRTGRMLGNAILLAYDYYPLSYRSIDEDEFKKALILFYEQGSLFHLKRLFIDQLIFAYETYFQ